MKIFYYFRELDTPMYRWQHTQIFDELQRYDINIVPFNPMNFISKDEANEKALSALRSDNFDMFMTCMRDDYFYDSTLQEIHKMGIPMLLFCPDNLELPYLHQRIAKYFDVVWLTSSETANVYKKFGAKRIVFQTYAANPYLYSPQWSGNIYSIGFIGSPYGSRANKLNLLINAGMNCSVYSDSLFKLGYNTSVGGKYELNICDAFKKGFDYLRFPIGRKVLYSTIKNKIITNSRLINDNPNLEKHHSISDEEMYKLYSNFVLSLNIAELRDTYCVTTPVYKVHLRTFEIPMCGGLQLTSYTDEIASYFEDGKEIVLYKNEEELLDKAKYYLSPSHEIDVAIMKRNARKRAEGEHTWKHRFDRVISEL